MSDADSNITIDGFRIVSWEDEHETDDNGGRLVSMDGDYAIVNGTVPMQGEDQISLSGDVRTMQRLAAALINRFGLPGEAQVLLVGNAVEGYSVHGPFLWSEDGDYPDEVLQRQARMSDRGDTWCVAKLQSLSDID